MGWNGEGSIEQKGKESETRGTCETKASGRRKSRRTVHKSVIEGESVHKEEERRLKGICLVCEL